MKKLFKFTPLIPLFSPLVASAQFVQTKELLKGFAGLVNYAIVLLVALALLTFFWGMFKFIRKAGEGDVKEGRAIMGWGLIALFIMVSVWGIVRFIQNDFLGPGTDYSAPNGLPSIMLKPGAAGGSADTSSGPTWTDVPPGYEPDPNSL